MDEMYNASVVKATLLVVDPDPVRVRGRLHQFAFMVVKMRASRVPWNPQEEPDKGARGGPACPICFDLYDDRSTVAVKTQCEHICCLSCLLHSVTMVAHQNKCPFCRSALFDRPAWLPYLPASPVPEIARSSRPVRRIRWEAPVQRSLMRPLSVAN
jgi:hypothetical protein